MFNKEKIKGFVSGFTVAVLISILTVSAFASSVGKTINVMYNNIKLVVDGQNIQFGKDSAGNQIEPFIYNGTTYLPVRAVGEAMGKSVDWDGKTSTVYIGKVNKDDADAYLTDKDYFNIQKDGLYYELKYWNSEKDKDSIGRSYKTGLKYELSGYSGEVYTEYLLNQEYKTFKGTFALAEESKSRNLGAVLKVYGDDKLLYTSEALNGGVLPIDFSVDVTGVIKLKIKIETNNTSYIYSYNPAYYGLLNPRLYK